jgi:hypothetical protein
MPVVDADSSFFWGLDVMVGLSEAMAPGGTIISTIAMLFLPTVGVQLSRSHLTLLAVAN